MLELHTDQRGRLIGHDQTLYSRIVWPSPLVRALTIATAFPTKALHIAHAFEQHLASGNLSLEERSLLEHWVIHTSPFFGPDHPGFIPHLYQHYPELSSFASREASAFEAFLRAVTDSPQLPPAIDAKKPKRILIVHGDRGGGTRAPAQATAEILREIGGFEPILLSFHAGVIGSSDPFYRIFGSSYAELWNQHSSPSMILALLQRLGELQHIFHDYFIPDSTERAARVFAGYQAAHILSFLPGNPLLAQVATPHLPLCYMHPDFGLCPPLFEPTIPRAPSPVFLFDPRRVTIGLAAELAEPALTRLRDGLGESYHQLIHPMGYPVRRPFRMAPSQLERLKAKLGLGETERLVLVMMGQNDNGEALEQVARLLYKAPANELPPLLVIVVCGLDKALKRRLETDFGGGSSAVRIRIEGYCEAEEIAAYMHLAAEPGAWRRGVLISKAGGSTTAECARTGAYLLLWPGYFWEEGNRRFVLEAGIGEGCSEGDLYGVLGRVLEERPSRWHEGLDIRYSLLKVVGAEPPRTHNPLSSSSQVKTLDI